MEKGIIQMRNSETGIALVTALLITLVVMMLIGSLTYLMTRQFGANVVNRQFSSAFEASSGGIEHGAGIIASYLDTMDTTGLGVTTPQAQAVIQNCDETTDLPFALMTADEQYDIDITIRCLGNQPLPGMGDSMAFPPPPGLAAGGGEQWYVFFQLNAVATETATGILGSTEAVYRTLQ